MKSVSLNAFPRSLTRRTGVKKLRSRGRVPAVIYGRNAPTTSLELDRKEIEDLIHESASETILVDLLVRGEAENKQLALVQEVQHHPLTGTVLHVDFHQVAENEKVTVAIPVESVGEAVGVKGGGVLEHVLFKVKLRALPRDLPEFVEVDVSHLEVGQAVHLGELKLPAGVEIVGDKDIPVIAVAAPITEAQEAATLEEATAPLTEPEMIKEKKGEGEGAGETAPAKGAAAVAPAKGAAAAAPSAGKAAPAAAKAGEKASEKKK